MVRAKVIETRQDALLSARELSSNFRALADVTRLRILRSLWQKEGATVTDLCDELRISQPLMSWHLRILRRAGLISTTRTGRQVHCTVSHDISDQYGGSLATFLESDPDDNRLSPGKRAGP